jgi:hypothetical protein
MVEHRWRLSEARAWDAVALVRYPTRRAFADMISDPDYMAPDPVRMSALAEGWTSAYVRERSLLGPRPFNRLMARCSWAAFRRRAGPGILSPQRLTGAGAHKSGICREGKRYAIHSCGHSFCSCHRSDRRRFALAALWIEGRQAMIAGHFGFAAFAKSREPRVPLWCLMLATV